VVLKGSEGEPGAGEDGPQGKEVRCDGLRAAGATHHRQPEKPMGAAAFGARPAMLCEFLNGSEPV